MKYISDQTPSMLRHLTCIFILLFTSHLSYSQLYDEKNFVHYTIKDELSNNYITSITQDSYGYLWVGTYKGLNRFDGNAFQHFYADSSQHSLPQDGVRKLKWLDNERLAVITGSWLHIINTRTLERRNLIIPPDSLKLIHTVNRVTDAVGDNDGNVYVISGTGFYHFNDKDHLVFRYDHYSSKDLETKNASFGWNVIAIENNAILLSTFFYGLYIYNSAEKKLQPAGNSDNAFYKQIAAAKRVVTLVSNDKKTMNVVLPSESELSWFNIPHKKKYSIKVPFYMPDNFDGGVGATVLRLNDSIYAINNKLNGFYLIHYDRRKDVYTLQPQHYLQDYVCTALLVDKENRLWIGTNKGLLRQKRSMGQIQQLSTADKKPSSRSEILSLVVSNNKLFAGTSGDGLLVFDRDNLTTIQKIDFSKYKENPFYANVIYSAASVDRDTVYTGTAGVWVNTKNLDHGKIKLGHLDSTNDGVDVLFKDSRNNIYLKKTIANLFYFRGANDKSFKVVDYSNDLSRIRTTTNIAEDSQGNLWFSGSGIARYNYRLKEFDIILDSFPYIKIPRKNVISNVVFDKKGNIYFGVYDNGLVVYDAATKNFSRLSREDGLPDNNIRALYLHNDKLWMGTESGLANYDLSTKKISSFGIADGVPADPYATFFLHYDSTHKQLYGAFKNTIFRFNPDSLTKNHLSPHFFIESVAITGKETVFHPDDHLRLSYKHNNLVINVGAINFEDAYQQQFAYRFVTNGDEPWQETGSQRSIIFSNLPEGDHKLQLKVFIKNNNWPEQIKEISIVIRPPFWKTAWFIGIIILLVGTFIYSLYRYRINRVNKRAEIDRLLAKTEMKALHAQMNPHFVFNSLNSIMEMVLNDDKTNASRYLSNYAQLIRLNLDHSQRTFITLRENIDYLRLYLELERIRTNSFGYAVEVAKNIDTDEILLPPMLIQPFIENAIWYGPLKSDTPMKLDIRFLKDNGQLLCIVDDNGIGIEASKKIKSEKISAHNPAGIANIRQRIQILNEKYRLNCSLTIEDKSEIDPHKTGTKVTIRLPLNIHDL